MQRFTKQSLILSLLLVLVVNVVFVGNGCMVKLDALKAVIPLIVHVPFCLSELQVSF